MLKKSRFMNTDDFDKQFAVINGAWRTNVEYFRDAYGTEDIAGVMIYSNYNLTPENKKAMLQLQQDTKIYADAVKAYFTNFYFQFKGGYQSMYPKEWIFEDQHTSLFQDELWYYIADPVHNPERKSVWTPTYYDAILEKWMVSLISPIYVNNTFYGTAGGDVPLQDIFTEISEANINGNGYAMIFDTDKNIVIHPHYLDEITKSGEMEELFTFKDIRQDELSKQIEKITNERGEIRFTENGKEQILLYQKLDSISWYYAFVIDASLFKKDGKVNVLPQKFYLLIAGALVVIMAALILLVKTGLIKIENNAVLLLLAVTLSIIIGLFVYNTYQTTQAMIEDKISSTATELASLANTQEHHINNLVNNLKKNAEIATTQEELTIDELKKIRELGLNTVEVIVMDSGGKVIASSDEASIGMDRSSYLSGSNTQAKIMKTPNTAKGLSVVITTPFHEGFLGYITDIEEIDGQSNILLDTTKTGESLIAYRNEQGYADIISDKRFTGPKEIPLDSDLPIVWTLQGNERAYNNAKDYRGSDVVAVARYIENLDAGLIVKIDKDEALSTVSQTTISIWIFTIGIIISILVTGIIFYYLLTNSLRRAISVKTAELQKNIKELEDTKAAVMNMMEDLSAANSNLKKLDEAKSNFLNMVSHELKTPLTAMLAHTEVLDYGHSPLTPQQHSSIDAIKRNCNQLRMLIENILEIARIESNKFQLIITKVDVNRVIMESVTNLRILAENKGIKLEQEIEKLPFINTDEIRLKEILNNLISNAIKFTEKGVIRVIAHREGHFVKVQVHDTGIGIPKQKMDELFTKFYQVDASLSRRYGGTGLGLSITKQLVELMGGTITVESEEGKGSVFSFTLPIGGKNEKNTVR
jgi:signal transduction histidine kinase